jgi:hypothetical protein
MYVATSAVRFGRTSGIHSASRFVEICSGTSSKSIHSLDHSKSQTKSDHRLHETFCPGWQAPINARFKFAFLTMLALTTVWSSGLDSCADDATISKDPGQPAVIKNSILRYGNYCGPGPAEVSPANDCNAVQGLPTVDAVDRQESLAAAVLFAKSTVALAPSLASHRRRLSLIPSLPSPPLLPLIRLRHPRYIALPLHPGKCRSDARLRRRGVGGAAAAFACSTTSATAAASRTSPAGAAARRRRPGCPRSPLPAAS